MRLRTCNHTIRTTLIEIFITFDKDSTEKRRYDMDEMLVFD